MSRGVAMSHSQQSDVLEVIEFRPDEVIRVLEVRPRARAPLPSPVPASPIVRPVPAVPVETAPPPRPTMSSAIARESSAPSLACPFQKARAQSRRNTRRSADVRSLVERRRPSFQHRRSTSACRAPEAEEALSLTRPLHATAATPREWSERREPPRLRVFTMTASTRTSMS